MTAPAVVALGGGHGLSASLGALRHLTDRLSAVVTVSDDGGSSGRLRRELGVLPPGDLRMALAALCADGDWGRTWRDVLQHRFASHGELHNHALGNLLIVALWELLGDTVEGLDWVGRLLGARGRVLPMAAEPLTIEATVLGLDVGDPSVPTTVRGQAAVAATRGHVASVRLLPEEPKACDEAVAAVQEADWVVLGPGSWFTSVMPHLLVPRLREAVIRTSAKRIVTLNLPAHDAETHGFTAENHLEALLVHAPELTVDVVVADPSAVGDRTSLEDVCQTLGAALVVSEVAEPTAAGVHDPLRLAAAYRDVMGTR
ncbi:MAG TPA: uridine diphosphate-N-acetylglucosamine-binding protein YvcK [Actinomycetales bacterium]|nr:uridine diphosphate-N-acetylglucosamine-binding protein YvcK [Actinomycetales bacterium]